MMKKKGVIFRNALGTAKLPAVIKTEEKDYIFLLHYILEAPVSSGTRQKEAPDP